MDLWNQLQDSVPHCLEGNDGKDVAETTSIDTSDPNNKQSRIENEDYEQPAFQLNTTSNNCILDTQEHGYSLKDNLNDETNKGDCTHDRENEGEMVLCDRPCLSTYQPETEKPIEEAFTTTTNADTISDTNQVNGNDSSPFDKERGLKQQNVSKDVEIQASVTANYVSQTNVVKVVVDAKEKENESESEKQVFEKRNQNDETIIHKKSCLNTTAETNVGAVETNPAPQNQQDARSTESKRAHQEKGFESTKFTLGHQDCLFLQQQIKNILGLGSNAEVHKIISTISQPLTFWERMVKMLNFGVEYAQLTEYLFKKWLEKHTDRSNVKYSYPNIQKKCLKRKPGKSSKGSSETKRTKVKPEKPTATKVKVKKQSYPRSNKNAPTNDGKDHISMKKVGRVTGASLQGALAVNDLIESGSVEIPLHDGCYVSALIKYRNYKGLLFDESCDHAKFACHSIRQMIQSHRLQEKKAFIPEWEIVPEQVILRRKTNIMPSIMSARQKGNEKVEKINTSSSVLGIMIDEATKKGIKSPKVVVVGAGLAGLTCAVELLRHRFDVTVVEARDRVGGRCWTLSEPIIGSNVNVKEAVGEAVNRIKGLHVDLGAGWIHGINHNPLTKLCSSFNVQLMNTGNGRLMPLYDCTGNIVNQKDDELAEIFFNEILDCAGHLGYEESLAEELYERLVRCNCDFLSLHSPRETTPCGQHNRPHCNKRLRQTVRSIASPEFSTVSSMSNVKFANRAEVQSISDALDMRPEEVAQVAISLSAICSNVELFSSYVEQEVPQSNVAKQENIKDLFDFECNCVKVPAKPQLPSFPHKSLGEIIREFQKQTNPPLTEKQKRVINWHISNLEYANASTVDSLSLQHWDQDDLYAFKGPHCLLRQGFGSIANSLANQLLSTGVEMVFNSNVSKIERIMKANENDENGYAHKVVITCVEGDKQKKHHCDFCVVTLPLGILKQQHESMFSPRLDLEKAKAIDRLGFGILNKVLLVFDSCFWDMSAQSIGYASSKTGDYYMFVNIFRHTGHFALLSILSGDLALRVESMSDQEVVDDSLSVLRRMFRYRNIPKQPIYSHVTRWKSDKFSRGSYSYLKPGSSPQDMDVLATPIDDCIFFAGEATNRKHPASAHGAVLSGRRDAKRIANIMAKAYGCTLPYQEVE